MRRKIPIFKAVYVSLLLTSCSNHCNEYKYEQSVSKAPGTINTNLKNKSKMEIKKPHRVSHTYEQTIHGSFLQIMPLYCPVRELDWCENWNPKTVYSYSGLVERDCIFITSHGETDVVWIVTDYDIEKGHAEMVYHIPGVLITKLEIQLTFITENTTRAIITYSKTSLTEAWNKLLEEFTKKAYDTMMGSWEKAMNHYLKTGEMMIGLAGF